jgi:hypothetical protein
MPNPFAAALTNITNDDQIIFDVEVVIPLKDIHEGCIEEAIDLLAQVGSVRVRDAKKLYKNSKKRLS